MPGAPRGERCRVFRCGTPATLDVLFPGGDVAPQWWSPLEEDDVVGHRTRVCAAHGAELGSVSIAFVELDVEKCAGWQLVVEFVKDPEKSNPIVLYPPGTRDLVEGEEHGG